MLRSVIIEDEAHNLNLLTSLLTRYCPEVQILGDSRHVYKAVETIQRIKPDLVFMDIQLEDGTAFDVLQLLPEITFRLIFVTAFERYAVKAFRFSALDFLVKPLDLNELVDAVRKAMTESVRGYSQQILNASHCYATQSFNKIALRDHESIHLIEVDNIVYCKADSNYTTFFFTDGKPIMVSKTIKEYELVFHDSGFLRIHRSYLINLKHLKQYLKGEGGVVLMSDESKIPVGESRKEELSAFLRNIRG